MGTFLYSSVHTQTSSDRKLEYSRFCSHRLRTGQIFLVLAVSRWSCKPLLSTCSRPLRACSVECKSHVGTTNSQFTPSNATQLDSRDELRQAVWTGYDGLTAAFRLVSSTSKGCMASLFVCRSVCRPMSDRWRWHISETKWPRTSENFVRKLPMAVDRDPLTSGGVSICYVYFRFCGCGVTLRQ